MTPEQERLKEEWERAKEESSKLWKLYREADSVADAAKKAYYESISEFKVGDYVYDSEGKLFMLTRIPMSYGLHRGTMVKKDGTLSKKTDIYLLPPLTKAEKP